MNIKYTFNTRTQQQLELCREGLEEVIKLYADDPETLHLCADGIMIDVIHALMYVVELPPAQIALIDEIIDLWNNAEKYYS